MLQFNSLVLETHLHFSKPAKENAMKIDSNSPPSKNEIQLLLFFLCLICISTFFKKFPFDKIHRNYYFKKQQQPSETELCLKNMLFLKQKEKRMLSATKTKLLHS